MGIAETLIIYLVVGGVVAAAMRVADNHSLSTRTIARLIPWAVLWPFFAPALLGKAVSGLQPHTSQLYAPTANARLHEAQQRLLHAIGSLEGLAEGVLKPQLTQIDAMMRSLDTADNRLREMEELLRTREFDMAQVDEALHDLRTKGYDDEEPRVRSLQARRRNIERLRAMRDRTREELERALAKIEEISSQVMLLRFADQPETKLAGLLKDVAGNVEDLASVVLEMSEI